MNNHSGTQDIYDTENHCAKCGARLYVSTTDVHFVLSSLRMTGLAGLMCVCGHIQFIGSDFMPRPHPQKRND